MKLVIEVNKEDYKRYKEDKVCSYASAVLDAVPLNEMLDKIRAEITDCLKALDEIEKSGFNIYLTNEISGRRLTYQQCLGFIDKHIGKENE